MNTSTLLLFVCVCCAVSYKGETSSTSPSVTMDPSSGTTEEPGNNTSTLKPTITNVTTPTPSLTSTSHAANTSTSPAMTTGNVQTTQSSSGYVPTWSKWGVLLVVAAFIV